MLAAFMLLGTQALVAVRHAHPGGEAPHHHAKEHSHLGNHHHSHHDHSHQHHKAVVEFKTPGTWASVAHFHFEWFGFAFSFPELPTDSDEGDTSEEPTTIVQFSKISIVPSAAPSASTMTREMSVGCVPLNWVIDTEIAASTLSWMPRQFSVCDAARRECSGVLLI